MELSTQAISAGFQLDYHASLGSTNEAGLAALKAGHDRLWIVADEQSAGRGRHGRGWSSPPGNLYASLALARPCASAVAPLLGFVAGLALIEAVKMAVPRSARPRLCLKWPNDLLLDHAKCAGILLEGTALAGGGQGVVIGLGVNIRHHPADLDRAAAGLATLNPDLTAPQLFEALSARLAANLDLFDHGAGFDAIRAGWLAHALPLGAPIRVRPPSGEREGRFSGIDREGHLLIDTATGIETIMVGDVFLTAPDVPAHSQGRE